MQTAFISAFDNRLYNLIPCQNIVIIKHGHAVGQQTDGCFRNALKRAHRFFYMRGTRRAAHTADIKNFFFHLFASYKHFPALILVHVQLSVNPFSDSISVFVVKYENKDIAHKNVV